MKCLTSKQRFVLGTLLTLVFAVEGRSENSNSKGVVNRAPVALKTGVNAKAKHVPLALPKAATTFGAKTNVVVNPFPESKSAPQRGMEITLQPQLDQKDKVRGLQQRGNQVFVIDKPKKDYLAYTYARSYMMAAEAAKQKAQGAKVASLKSPSRVPASFGEPVKFEKKIAYAGERR